MLKPRTLIDVAGKTAGGDGPFIQIVPGTMAAFFVNISAGSGTGQLLDIQLVGKLAAAGPTFFIPIDNQMENLLGSAPIAGRTFRLNRTQAAGPQNTISIVNAIPAAFIRATWVITGTTPSFDFDIEALVESAS